MYTPCWHSSLTSQQWHDGTVSPPCLYIPTNFYPTREQSFVSILPVHGCPWDAAKYPTRGAHCPDPGPGRDLLSAPKLTSHSWFVVWFAVCPFFLTLFYFQYPRRIIMYGWTGATTRNVGEMRQVSLQCPHDPLLMRTLSCFRTQERQKTTSSALRRINRELLESQDLRLRPGRLLQYFNTGRSMGKNSLVDSPWVSLVQESRCPTPNTLPLSPRTQPWMISLRRNWWIPRT